MVSLHPYSGGEDAEPYNQEAVDFLRRLPGITDSNYRRAIRAIDTVADLADLSEQEMARILGDARQAKTLHTFINTTSPLYAQAYGAGGAGGAGGDGGISSGGGFIPE